MAKTLQELLARRSPESQARIQKMADELLLENQRKRPLNTPYEFFL